MVTWFDTENIMKVIFLKISYVGCIENLRKAHPHLKLIINEDALSPNAPHIRDLEKYNIHYILGVKPGDHTFLFNYIGAAAQE